MFDFWLHAGPWVFFFFFMGNYLLPPSAIMWNFGKGVRSGTLFLHGSWGVGLLPLATLSHKQGQAGGWSVSPGTLNPGYTSLCYLLCFPLSASGFLIPNPLAGFMEEGGGVGTWRMWKAFWMVGMAWIEIWSWKSSKSSLEYHLCIGKEWEIKLMHQIDICVWKVSNGKSRVSKEQHGEDEHLHSQPCRGQLDPTPFLSPPETLPSTLSSLVSSENQVEAP